MNDRAFSGQFSRPTGAAPCYAGVPMPALPEPWRVCGACKKPIPYGARYWTCSVSTCNRARFQLVFCSMDCWDSHVPVMNHRNAWAEEKVAPRTPAADPPTAPAAPATDPARRRVVRPEEPESDDGSPEVLVIASRLKAYIRERSDFNTSEDALTAVSEIIRRATETAIRNARAEGRRTVKGRDYEG